MLGKGIAEVVKGKDREVLGPENCPLEKKKHTDSLNTEVNKLRDEVRCRKMRHERKRKQRENRDWTCMVILTRVGPTFKDCTSRILSLYKMYSRTRRPF